MTLTGYTMMCEQTGPKQSVRGRGQDPHLFVVGQHFGGPGPAQPSGRVVAFPAPAPGAGKP